MLLSRLYSIVTGFPLESTTVIVAEPVPAAAEVVEILITGSARLIEIVTLVASADHLPFLYAMALTTIP